MDTRRHTSPIRFYINTGLAAMHQACSPQQVGGMQPQNTWDHWIGPSAIQTPASTPPLLAIQISEKSSCTEISIFSMAELANST